jgi:hypothetical protein
MKSLIVRLSIREMTRAKAQSTPSSEGRVDYLWKNYSPLFSDLCGLGVFARDIPSSGRALSAALGTLR